MKVLIAGPNLHHPGGVSNFINLLLKHADRDGLVFKYVPEGKIWMSSPKFFRPFEMAIRLILFFSSYLWFRPDIVHLNPSMNLGSLPMNVSLLMISRLRPGTRSLLFFHGWDAAIAENMIAGGRVGRWMARQLRRADHFMVLSPAFEEQLVRAGVDRKKISQITPMVETQNYSPDLGSPNKAMSQFSVLYVSRLVRSKGVWTVIGAAEWWRVFHPSAAVCFVIAGEGPEFQKVWEYVVEKNLQPFISLLGHVSGESKHQLYVDADMFVFPSIYPEGFPTVVMEAMAAGLPVVYTPVGGLGYLLAEENGAQIELNEITGEILGSKIWSLYQENEARLKMGVRNREIAQALFDCSVITEKIVARYQDISK